jgi:ribosomal protein S18 acetylase RimI-like enzyme
MNPESGFPVPLRPAQNALAYEMLGRAFENDPMSISLLPEEPRRRSLTAYMAVMVCYCQQNGWVDVITGQEKPAALAAWLPPGKTTPTLWGYIRAALRVLPLSFNLRNIRRATAYDDFTMLLHHRLAPMPHWYLMLLAVAPGQQGRMLAPRLAQADAAGLPVYLDTHNPRNPPFYQKHGFQIVFDGKAPRSDLHYWAMLRKPL